MPDSLIDWLPRRLLDQVSDAVVVTDAQVEPPGPTIVYANCAWERVTGHRVGDVLGQGPFCINPRWGTDTLQDVTEQLRQCLEDRRTIGGPIQGRTDDKASPIGWWVEPIYDATGQIAGLALIEHRTRAEGHADATDAFNVIHELRNLLKNEPLDLAGERQRVARTAMHLAGADGAAVEEVDGNDMVYQAVAGVAEDLAFMRLPVDGSASGYCYTSGEPLLVGDTETDGRTQLGAKAAASGFRSGILVPLVHGDQRFGVLKVFSGQRDAFGPSERDFVEILADLLAAVLYRAQIYELEAERRRHLVDALPMLVAYVDSGRRYREVNAAYADWFGKPIGEVLGKPIWEIIGDAAYEYVRPYMDRAMETGEAVSYEETVTFPHQRPTVISVDYSPDVASDGAVVGFYAIVRDITKAHAADTDYLTGLANRRRFEDEGHRQIEVHRRYGRALSLIIADIDYLKWWNDTQGHLTGDRIVRQVGEQLQRQARATDLVARWGGEEFVILAPETDVHGATALAERVRGQIASERQTEGYPVTLSMGVAEAQGKELSLRRLIRAADDALYGAKNAGRNRVHQAQPTLEGDGIAR